MSTPALHRHGPALIALWLASALAPACSSETTSPASDSRTPEVFFPDAVTLDAPSSDTSPETSTPADTTEPLDTAPPADLSEPTDTTPPTDLSEPTDTTPPADLSEPADTTPPADLSEPADTTPPTDTTPPADTEPGLCQEGGCETDITKLGNTCANAYVIGRPNAQAGFGHLGSTIGAGNDSDFPQTVCGDSGPDRFYKIYLKVGEQLWANANPSPASYDLTFGLYRGANCETPITCVDNDVNGTTPDTMPYQATVEGWHVLVIDGRNSQGDYSLVVTLECHEADCCCP